MDMRRLFVLLAEAVALLLLSPLLLWSRLPLSPFSGFTAPSQLLSLVPGMTGVLLRRLWYRWTLKSCGRNLTVDWLAVIRVPDTSVGNHCTFGVANWIGLATIGDDVITGSHVAILSGRAQHGFADLDQPVPKRYTDSVIAYGLYLKGRFAWNKRTQEGVIEGIEYFEQAITEDPGYALAYTGLADSYALQIDYRNVAVRNGFARAKEYALKALELDESLAEAHASLAWTLFIYDWDWEGASREFKRSIELDPRYATAHQWYAFLLASQGRLDECLVEAHTAQELDPASVSIRRGLGYV